MSKSATKNTNGENAMSLVNAEKILDQAGSLTSPPSDTNRLEISAALSVVYKRKPTQAQNIFHKYIEALISLKTEAIPEIWLLFTLVAGLEHSALPDLPAMVRFDPSKLTSKPKILCIGQIKLNLYLALECTKIEITEVHDLVLAIETLNEPAAKHSLINYMVNRIKSRPDEDHLTMLKALLVLMDNLEFSGLDSVVGIVRPHARLLQRHIRAIRPPIPQLIALIEEPTIEFEALAKNGDWIKLAHFIPQLSNSTTATKLAKILSTCATATYDTHKDILESLIFIFERLSFVLESKPDLLRAMSNALFNIGSKCRPNPFFMNIWSSSLKIDARAGICSRHLYDKTERFLLGLTEVPIESTAVATSFPILLSELDSKLADNILLPLPEKWLKIVAAINKLEPEIAISAFSQFDSGLEFLFRALAYSSPSQKYLSDVMGTLLTQSVISPNKIAQYGCIYYRLTKTLHESCTDTLVTELRPDTLVHFLSIMIEAKEFDWKAICKHTTGIAANTLSTDDTLLLLDILQYSGLIRQYNSMIKNLPMEHDEYVLWKIVEHPLESHVPMLIDMERKLRTSSIGGVAVDNSRTSLLIMQAFADILIANGRASMAIPVLERLVLLLYVKSESNNSLKVMSMYMEATFRLSQCYEHLGSVRDAEIHLKEALTKASKAGLVIRRDAYNLFLHELVEQADQPESTETCQMRQEKVLELVQYLRSPIFPSLGLDSVMGQLASAKASISNDSLYSIVNESALMSPSPCGFDQDPKPSFTTNLETITIGLSRFHGCAGSWKEKSLVSKAEQSAKSLLATISGYVNLTTIPQALDLPAFQFVESYRAARKVRHQAADPLSMNLRRTSEEASSLPENVIATRIELVDSKLILSRTVPDVSDFFVTLPLSRMSSITDKVPHFRQVLADLDTVITETRRHSSYSGTDQKRCSSSDAREWWKQQVKLDRQLAKILEDIEVYWLGGFRGMFDTHNYHGKSELVDLQSRIVKIIHKYVQPYVQRTEVEVSLNLELVHLFASLANPSLIKRREAIEDLIIFILDTLRFRGLKFEYEDVATDVLIHEISQTLAGFTPHDTTTRRHLVIIPDSKAHQIPWESLKYLESVPATRALSFDHLKRMAELSSVSTEHISYVLNPGKDLVSTQKEFEAEFKLRGWHGFSGKSPTEREIAGIIEQSSCYVFVGHGAGDAYIRASTIKKLRSCGPIILLGCSSAKLKATADYDSFGPVTDYAIAGCPLFVGNLWDVPDKDINRFSKEFLSRFFDDGESASCSVLEARSACLLRYTTGAAPVIYGLPIYSDRIADSQN